MISVYPLALAALCVLPFVIEAQRDLTLTLNRISQSESPNAKCIDGEFNFNHFSPPPLSNLFFFKKLLQPFIPSLLSNVAATETSFAYVRIGTAPAYYWR